MSAVFCPCVSVSVVLPICLIGYSTPLHYINAARHYCRYKGIGPTMVSGAPYTGLQMTFFDIFKGMMPRDEHGKQSPYAALVAGACSGLVSQVCACVCLESNSPCCCDSFELWYFGSGPVPCVPRSDSSGSFGWLA